jgi:hypothetical protein
MVAGILDIVAGVIGILAGIGLAGYPEVLEDIGIGVALYVLGIVAIIGGICALRRRVWGLPSLAQSVHSGQVWGF